VVRANLAAAEAETTGPINIGTGVEGNVLELIEALAPHAHADFTPDHQPERTGEIRHIAIDSTRAREELGWEARIGLAEGIEQTLASYE
jgi:UDP-glucose 4-epimerase